MPNGGCAVTDRAYSVDFPAVGAVCDRPFGPDVSEPLTLLLGLAVNADAGPRDSVKAGGRDLIFALHADSVSTLFDAMDGFVDGPEEFRIGLFESKPDVNVVFLAGLVDPIAALRSRFCRRGSSGRGSHQAFLFLFENIFVFLYFDRTHAFVPRTNWLNQVRVNLPV